MTFLKNKHEAFAAKDLKTKVVDCKEYWGCDVIVRSLNIEDRLKLAKLMQDNDTHAYVACYVVIFGVVNEEGNRIFTEDDLPDLLQKDFDCINKIANAIGELNTVDEGIIKKKPEK